MIGKPAVGSGQLDLRHVTRCALLLTHRTGRSRAPASLCLAPGGEMTSQTLFVVEGCAFRQPVVWIVTGDAADPGIPTVSSAIKHSVRLITQVIRATLFWHQ